MCRAGFANKAHFRGVYSFKMNYTAIKVFDIDECVRDVVIFCCFCSFVAEGTPCTA